MSRKQNETRQEYEKRLIGLINEGFHLNVEDLVYVESAFQSSIMIRNIEEENGCPLDVLMKAIKYGFYYENDDGKIYFMRYAVLVNSDTFVEVKPCYAVKETTLESCYSGDVSPLKEVKDAHYWDWKTCRNWKTKNYKKNWWLKRDKSE